MRYNSWAFFGWLKIGGKLDVSIDVSSLYLDCMEVTWISLCCVFSYVWAMYQCSMCLVLVGWLWPDLLQFRFVLLLHT